MQAAVVKLDPAASLSGVAQQVRLQLMAIHAGTEDGGVAEVQSKVTAAATSLRGSLEQLSSIKQVCATFCFVRPLLLGVFDDNAESTVTQLVAIHSGTEGGRRCSLHLQSKATSAAKSLRGLLEHLT